MRKYILSTLLLLSVAAGAQTTTPTWLKVAGEGNTITTTGPHVFRFGSGTTNCWSANLTITPTNFVTTYTNFLATYKVPDPCVSITKEIDVQEEATPFTVTVNNNPVLVPAVASTVVTPPVTTPPTTTAPMIPVVFNGTKYQCSNIALDNTGTLTLTCK